METSRISISRGSVDDFGSTLTLHVLRAASQSKPPRWRAEMLAKVSLLQSHLELEDSPLQVPSRGHFENILRVAGPPEHYAHSPGGSTVGAIGTERTATVLCWTTAKLDRIFTMSGGYKRESTQSSQDRLGSQLGVKKWWVAYPLPRSHVLRHTAASSCTGGASQRVPV